MAGGGGGRGMQDNGTQAERCGRWWETEACRIRINRHAGRKIELRAGKGGKHRCMQNKGCETDECKNTVVCSL